MSDFRDTPSSIAFFFSGVVVHCRGKGPLKGAKWPSLRGVRHVFLRDSERGSLIKSKKQSHDHTSVGIASLRSRLDTLSSSILPAWAVLAP